jgi:uroporphyrinogen decarboxylase
MNHKERFRNALLLKPVDKLPHGEQMIHDALVAKILQWELPDDHGNALARWMSEPLSDENFERHKRVRAFLGMDYVQVFPREPANVIGHTAEGHQKVRDIWGTVQIVTDQTSEIIEKPIQSAEAIKHYEFPRLDAFQYDNISRWVQDGEYFVAAQIDTGYFKANQLVGFEDYMLYLLEHKPALHELMEKFTQFQIEMADHLIKLGVDCIWLSDDHAYNSGPFISPALFREFDLRYMRQIVAHVRAQDVPVVLHSCGNLNYTLRDIVETGINGLHAIQPSAHNDIYAYKRTYGHTLCFLGNMDINELLPNGSPWEIDQKVQEMVAHMFADRTGFILTTCNLLGSDVPVENAITMHLSAEKYGR